MRQNLDKVERSETSFCVCPVPDEKLLSSTGVLLVHNVADMAIHGREGKYAAWGFPGGGVNQERMENASQAARNEVKGETGLSISRLIHLFTDGKLIVSEIKTQKLLRQFFFRIGQRPSHSINPYFQKAIENPIHIFLARLEWEKSQVRRILLEAREQRLKGLKGAKKKEALDDIEENGIFVYFNEIPKEAVDSLQIEEIDEIDGIGVFPVSLMQDKEFLEYTRSLPQNEREIYPTHLMWFEKAMTQLAMGKINL